MAEQQIQIGDRQNLNVIRSLMDRGFTNKEIKAYFVAESMAREDLIRALRMANVIWARDFQEMADDLELQASVNRDLEEDEAWGFDVANPDKLEEAARLIKEACGTDET